MNYNYNFIKQFENVSRRTIAPRHALRWYDASRPTRNDASGSTRNDGITWRNARATWYDGTTVITNILDPSNLVADTFQYIIGNQGCMDTATIMIYASIPAPLSSNDTSITVDQQIPLWTSGGSSYIWTPSIYLDSTFSSSVISTPGEDITYYIEVYDSLGCMVIDTINITVNYNPLFIPNGFSPNNDNNNDVLYVRGGGVSSIQFRVFDKWGNLVFESFDMDTGWDGTYNGKLLNTGVFVYRMDAVLKNGKPLFESGNVTLFR